MARVGTLTDGEWWKCGMKFHLICCDCGLTHSFVLHKKKGRMWIKVNRNERATAAVRREKRKHGKEWMKRVKKSG
jgi:predicted amidophosphoribosyltransferase